ncbi:hypothetical protein OESDEN_11113 [Oesophagostomum dentatum]|uniref:Uncharacterized protein n=1 Tax=Oesophagostomum dentatum TaxID=61180 RepID=A0A0B1T0X1_OESDE|nr:hypothetical protein OESDEN_11113 [Oesophagostomum dentatum]
MPSSWMGLVGMTQGWVGKKVMIQFFLHCLISHLKFVKWKRM